MLDFQVIVGRYVGGANHKVVTEGVGAGRGEAVLNANAGIGKRGLQRVAHVGGLQDRAVGGAIHKKASPTGSAIRSERHAIAFPE